MILGTAGHIDHGKTTLVHALTGVNTDRLPEEQRRGITIDLGFAPLELEGVGQVGIVDVPGHEAFVRTMVAGAAGIDVALVVIAADEGLMPQTHEHLAILEFLGVQRGVVALTKSDLVEAEWLELVSEEVREALARGPLADAPIVAVSARTGAGLTELRTALAAAAHALPPRGRDDLFRMPIDRVFSVRGTGTVVTGTVWSGTLARDASVRALPLDRLLRVRGLQAHDRPVDRVEAGQRAAIALAGVDVADLARGAVLVQGAGWSAARRLRADVLLDAASLASIGPRTRFRFHLGTSDVGARLVLAGLPSPDDVMPARIVLDEPVVMRAGDRFVLRRPSPASTVGGGIVSDPSAPHRARAWSAASLSPEALLRQLLAEAGRTGVPVAELEVKLGLSAYAVMELLEDVKPWREGEHLLPAEARERAQKRALDVLAEFHRQEPLEPGAPLQWLRSRLELPEEFAHALVASLVKNAQATLHGHRAALASFSPQPTPAQQALADRIVELFRVAAAESPTVGEVVAATGSEERAIGGLLRHLARQGVLVELEPDRFIHAPALEKVITTLSAGVASGATFSPADARTLLGVSRKYLIPLLEYLDGHGVTVRATDGSRTLTPV